MIRTQVYLTRAQHRALKREAVKEGLSMTALLRRILDAHSSGRSGGVSFPKEAVLSFIGLGSSGRSGTAADHDAALDEALRDSSLR